MIDFSKIKHVHFIGVGGIGISALAQWFLTQKCKVSGSNLSRESILSLLKKKGAKIKIGKHKTKNIPKDTELIIYTSAAPKDNSERIEARRRKIPELSYPQAVGELTKKYFTIAICGSHGKSTTTALAALTLIEAGLDPTVIVGTKLKKFGGSNFRSGRSKYLVLEADEWAGAFWNYHPKIIIWTNVDKEHLDFYKNFNGVLASFKKFLKNLDAKGSIIGNFDDPNIRKILSGTRSRHLFYSLKNKEADGIRKIIKIPGEHNVSNALAVLKLTKALKIKNSVVFRAIGDYQGAWRRFEYRGTINGAPIYDDYGHHPTEVKATLKAAREKFPDKKIWLVYQPHQIQRTTQLFDEFTRAFGGADYIILLDIYNVSGREKIGIGKGINSKKLADAVRKRDKTVIYKSSFKKAADLLNIALGPKDVCLIMGAGDTWKIFPLLKLKNHIKISFQYPYHQF